MDEDVRKLIEDPAFRDYEALGKEAAFNAFDVLRYSDYEIRHSNVLSWLLTPGETHGVGDAFLTAFMKLLKSRKHKSAKAFPESGFGPRDVRVKRELDYVDIMVFFETAPRLLLVLENKPVACSKEHWKQLKRYIREQREKRGDSYDIRGVLLTASREAKCKRRDCVHLSWHDVRKLVDVFLKKGCFPPCDTASFVRQYVEIVERNILGLGPSADCFHRLQDRHGQIFGRLLNGWNSEAEQAEWGIPDCHLLTIERLLQEFRQQPFELRRAVREFLSQAGYETAATGAPGGTAYWLSFWDEEWYPRADALGLAEQGWCFEFTHRSVRAKLGGGVVSAKARQVVNAVMDVMRRRPVEGTDPSRFPLKFESVWPSFYRHDLVAEADFAVASPEEIENRTLAEVERFLGSADSDYRKIERYLDVLAFRPSSK